MIANCRVVLVRPHYAGNIGSVARAMKNFGLNDLVLVDPVANPLAHEARMLATGGCDILDAVRIVPDFAAAVGDCRYVLGSSGEIDGTLRQTLVGTPRELFPAFAETLSQAPCALVFGPEPHGLSNAELAVCHGLLFLPTDPEYTSMNLALAVGVALYELRLAVRARVAANDDLARTPAPYAEFDLAMEHLRAALADVRFLFGQNGELLMQAFRHLIARAKPTRQEVKMLHGLARQLEYAADRMTKAEAMERAHGRGTPGDGFQDRNS